jgi:hypothetical protein
LAFATERERHGTRLRAAVVFLGLATWLCYVGDRILDARSSGETLRLRERHRFYGKLWRDRRAALLAALGLGALACIVVGLRGLDFSLLEGYAALTAISLVYFVWVHFAGRRSASAASKEAIVGIIFAVACVLPAWNASTREAALLLIPEDLVFAALCWLNCVAIERWEGRDVLSPLAHRSTRWAAVHLGPLLASGTFASAGLALLRRHDVAQLLLALSLGGAFALLGLLEARRRRLSVEALRILADAALLTPIPWVVLEFAFK